jgi:hypothetical protein
MMTDTVLDRGRAAEERGDATYVPAEEFRRLLVSSRKMVRSDESGGKIRGLLDVQTGMRFLIARDELLRG